MAKEEVGLKNALQQNIEDYSFESSVEVDDDVLSEDSEFEIQENSESVEDLQVEDEFIVEYQDDEIQNLQIDEITESDNDTLDIMDFNTQIHESYDTLKKKFLKL